jgi:hypothetical protein
MLVQWPLSSNLAIENPPLTSLIDDFPTSFYRECTIATIDYQRGNGFLVGRSVEVRIFRC